MPFTRQLQHELSYAPAINAAAQAVVRLATAVPANKSATSLAYGRVPRRLRCQLGARACAVKWPAWTDSFPCEEKIFPSSGVWRAPHKTLYPMDLFHPPPTCAAHHRQRKCSRTANQAAFADRPEAHGKLMKRAAERQYAACRAQSLSRLMHSFRAICRVEFLLLTINKCFFASLECISAGFDRETERTGRSYRRHSRGTANLARPVLSVGGDRNSA